MPRKQRELVDCYVKVRFVRRIFYDQEGTKILKLRIPKKDLNARGTQAGNSYLISKSVSEYLGRRRKGAYQDFDRVESELQEVMPMTLDRNSMHWEFHSSEPANNHEIILAKSRRAKRKIKSAPETI